MPAKPDPKIFFAVFLIPTFFTTVPAQPEAVPMVLNESLDFEINAAAKITRAANETTALRAKSTIEGRRRALEKFQEVVGLSKVKQDRVWEAVAVISSGLIYERLGEMQKALGFYLRELGNREYTSTALNNLGGGYKILGDYERTIFYLDQELEIVRAIKDWQGEAITLRNLGKSFWSAGDKSRAAENFALSNAHAEQLGDRRVRADTFYWLALFEREKGNLPARRSKAISRRN